MPLLKRILGTVRPLVQADAVERELDDELHAVLEMLIAEKVQAGYSVEQAQREARLELGGVEQVKASVRESRHGAQLDAFLQDVRFALRTMRTAPGLTVVAVVTLAIGIGATTALFSTINAVLLHGLPFAESERLVAGVKTIDERIAGPVSRVDYFDYREQCRSFSDLALITTGEMGLSATDGESTELVRVAAATWNLLSTLRIHPQLGRPLEPADELQRNGRVAMISHGLWQRRFAGSAEVVGASLELEGLPVTMIGVLPPGFDFLHADVDVWLLIDRDGPNDPTRDSHSNYLVGRLAPGVSLEQAQLEVDAVAGRLADEFPDTNRGKGLLLIDLHRFMVWQSRPRLVVLMATASLVLLIACGNVAGLLLARGRVRLSEMAMRTALGASRWRLVRQLLTESVILTSVAGVLGIGLAALLQRGLVGTLELGDPGIGKPAIDLQALLFALGVSIGTGLLVGIVPALRNTSVSLAQQLRADSHASEGVAGVRLRSVMVAAQVALSLLLLVSAGLLGRSLANMAGVELGFVPAQVLTASVRIQAGSYPTPEQRRVVFAGLLEEIERLPGVVSAAMVSKLPIRSTSTDWPIWPADQPRPTNQEARMALARWASPGYFATLGMPLLRGRDLDDSDLPSAERVVVVSEAVARGLFDDEDPIGQRVGIGWMDDPFEVVGVVGNARINGLRSDFDWAMYIPMAQADATGVGLGLEVTSMGLVVQTDGDPEGQVEPIRRVLHETDPSAVLSEPMTMQTIVDDDTVEFRTVMVALGLLAAVALALTSVGLYGVLAYQVSQRRNELGIRMAVGATVASVVGLIVRQGLALVAVGAVIGTAVAVPAARLLQQMLFGVEPFDAIVYVTAAVGLMLIGTLACMVPAYRASRVSLVEVLRRD